jgi:hypothetical protein
LQAVHDAGVAVVVAADDCRFYREGVLTKKPRAAGAAQTAVQHPVEPLLACTPDALRSVPPAPLYVFSCRSPLDPALSHSSEPPRDRCQRGSRRSFRLAWSTRRGYGGRDLPDRIEAKVDAGRVVWVEMQSRVLYRVEGCMTWAYTECL